MKQKLDTARFELGRIVQGFLALALVLFLSGCDFGKADEERPSPEEAARQLMDEVQRSPKKRVELVAEADALAIKASSLAGRSAANDFVAAAELRELAFQRFGRRADALEAIELWSDGALTHEDIGCEAGLRIARLRAQLDQDPRAQYRDLYLLQERYPAPSCQTRVSRALSVLDAFRPGREELAELRDRLVAISAHRRDDAVEHEHSPGKRSVVVPEVLRASLNQPTTLTQVEPFSAERTARVIVHVTHPTKFSVGSLAAGGGQGPRLFVDIDHASFEGLEDIETTGLVQRVRLGKQDRGSRVVLDLAEPAHHRAFYLPEPFRLVIDLSLDAPERSEQLRKIRRVVLDPGHGGHDPGAVAANGLQEKDVTLDIAHRAAPLLAREAGVSTLLTRDMDVYVPLGERTARANAFHADLFISIHLNSSPDEQSRGVMTFVLDSSKDSAASRIAARENDSTEAAAVELANSLSRIESASRRQASETFAQLLQRAAGASLRQRYDEIEDHGVRKAGFYVLAGASMPAVLFEGSFLSHPAEALRLNDADYRQRLADALVNAVRAYRDGL